MDRQAKIFITGHRGMVGSAILKLLRERGYQNLIFTTPEELDLRNQGEVEKFMRKQTPEYVFLFAARVGGIKANIDFPADFLYDNLMIEANLIHTSYEYKVKKLLYLGSSCIYPQGSLQPMKEEYLLTGELEPTNEAYAIAKISGIKLCQAYNRQHGTNFISLIPANLYGFNDNFDFETAHVLPVLIRKMHEAKINHRPSVTVWGSGKPRREFLHVDDLSEACIYLMDVYNGSQIINVGTGKDISIEQAAFLIKEITGFKGEIIFDPSEPDGHPHKLLDLGRLNKLGWRAKIELRDGLRMTYDWYCQNISI